MLEFPNRDWILGVGAGGHLIFHAEIGCRMTRNYAPISPVNMKGSAYFAIKIYRASGAWPGYGLFTQYLEDKVNVGDSILCEGPPAGKIKYLGFGDFNLFKRPFKHRKTKIGLIAGGSGITPLYSIAQASIYADDGLEIVLLFSNKTKADIICLR